MFDNERHSPAPPISTIPNLEFLRVKLASAIDGRIFVAMTATTVDDQESQLLNQEIASDRVATIDDALALIAERVRASSQHFATGKES